MATTPFFDGLTKFITENGIVGTTAGVIIALSTKDLILSLVSNIVIPLIITVFLRLKIKWVSDILSSKNVHFDLTNFMNLFITWIITLIITYYFIKTIFQSFLGVSNTPLKSDQTKQQ